MNSTCPVSICKYRNRVTGYCSHQGPCIEIASGTSENIRSEGVKMPEGLTKMGYDMIVDRIITKKIQPPSDKTCFELNAWLQGYADCQNAILEIIGKMKDQYGR